MAAGASRLVGCAPMKQPLFLSRAPRFALGLALGGALGALGAAGCAANDPASGGGSPGGAPAAQAAGPAPVEARDVAILVLEQAPGSLRVVSSSRRPRSSFGPSAGWNGSGRATHRWALVGANGATLASGDIAARGAVEAPPNPQQGAPAVNVPQASFSFDVRVPQPGPGEAIEITPADGSAPTVRWP